MTCIYAAGSNKPVGEARESFAEEGGRGRNLRKNASTARGSLSISTSNVPPGKVGNFVSPTCCPPPHCQWTCQCDNPAFNEIRAVDTCGFRLGNYIIMRLKPRKEEHDYSSIHRRFFFQCEDRNSLANFFLHPLSLFFSLVEREASFRNERGCTCRVYAGETRRAR